VVVHVGVVGSAVAAPELEAIAERVGRELALAGAVVVSGGLGGVMAAASRGAVRAGGMTIGILPGSARDQANEWVRVAVPTGFGELRNGLVVRASHVVIAIGGEYGTLSEVALALKTGVPVVGVGTWSLIRPDGGTDRGIIPVEVDDAVPTALALVASA
jgi:uncharacterized protein (TIGR00725 family)